MDFDLQSRTAAVRYDGAPGWPSFDPGGDYLLANLNLPDRLKYRRVWCGVFAIPDGNGEPAFSLQLQAVNSRGSQQNLFDWRVDYRQPAVLSLTTLNDGTVQIRPPFAATVELSDPDKTSAPHAGAVDSRVAQWRDNANGNVRLTMFPMEFSAEWQAIRLRIFDWTYNNSNNPSGSIFSALMVQSQLLPF